MPPWEKDDDELVNHVGIRDVKVVFESRDVDIAIELDDLTVSVLEILCRGKGTNILFHILLTSHDRAFTNLETHLSRRIVHYASKCWVHIIGLSHACLTLLRISIARLL